jgi:hypothetical protein
VIQKFRQTAKGVGGQTGRHSAKALPDFCSASLSIFGSPWGVIERKMVVFAGQFVPPQRSERGISICGKSAQRRSRTSLSHTAAHLMRRGLEMPAPAGEAPKIEFGPITGLPVLKTRRPMAPEDVKALEDE